jgi:hypothetical protein
VEIKSPALVLVKTGKATQTEQADEEDGNKARVKTGSASSS